MENQRLNSLHLAAAHQVDAGQQDALNVEQRLDAARPFLVEQPPLRLGKAQVMMAMIARDAAGRQTF